MYSIQGTRITTKSITKQSMRDWSLKLNRPSLVRFPHDPEDIRSLNLEEDSEMIFRSIVLQTHLQ